MFDSDYENDDFLRDDVFDVNWFDSINKDLASLVLNEGVFIRKFEDTGSTWWSLYSYKGQEYVGLCDMTDMWLLDEDMSEKINNFV